ncbi:MAG: hypothetical protein H6577_00960 [Lewinellaceae bacterium]|nr:hypothetical protein [Saprospiraceae bacterium]MCB9336678.1 hypothetical protein [Lewinellaceae bacterium]
MPTFDAKKQLEKIKIATWNTPLLLEHADHCMEQFAEKGVEAALVLAVTGSPFEGTEKLNNALRTGAADMAIQLLKYLPTTQPEGLVIAALSQRSDPSEWLIVPLASIADQQLFKLKQEPKVGVFSTLQKAQMSHFRPDAVFFDVKQDMKGAIEQLRRGDFDALIAGAMYLNHLDDDLSYFHIVKFNPIEFLPTPGEGVFAYQCCADDFEIRRLVRLMHHPEVSAVTNIERKLLKMLGDKKDLPLGVFCEQDQFGHFHIHAAIADALGRNLRKARISQNTHLLLAENLVEALGA